MKEFDNNPRKISKRQKKLLLDSMKKYGDLSCIVHNIKDDQLVGGNQRSKAIDINKCEIEITKKFNKPNKVGTIAYGFVVWKGERFMYRKVDWDKETAKAANIVANKLGGVFDDELLATGFEFDELIGLGFEEEELKFFDDGKDGLNFGLNSGEKDPVQQMTFTMRDEQVQEVKEALKKAKARKDFKEIDFYGNKNANGNAINLIIREWVELKK